MTHRVKLAQYTELREDQIFLASLSPMGWTSYIGKFGYTLHYLLAFLLAYSKEMSPSWEANWFAASQEILCILWKPKVHYRIHKCSFVHSPCYLVTLLGLNILLNTLLSNTLSLRSSLNVRNQVSNPCKTTGKITVLCILIFKFLDSKLEDKRFCTE
jgi:hypothetical protein